MTKFKICSCHATSSSFSNRSGRPEVFCKKEVLKNFVKFKGKHPSQSLVFDNVAEAGHQTLLVHLWVYRNTSG